MEGLKGIVYAADGLMLQLGLQEAKQVSPVPAQEPLDNLDC